MVGITGYHIASQSASAWRPKGFAFRYPPAHHSLIKQFPELFYLIARAFLRFKSCYYLYTKKDSTYVKSFFMVGITGYHIASQSASAWRPKGFAFRYPPAHHSLIKQFPELFYLIARAFLRFKSCYYLYIKKDSTYVKSFLWCKYLAKSW